MSDSQEIRWGHIGGIVGAFVAVTALIFPTLYTQYYMPRYVFVDGGAHVGETVEDFTLSTLYRMHEWEIVSIEANPEIVSAGSITLF